MKVRILYRQDGGINIIHPVPNSKRPGETEEQWLKRVFDKATPEGLEYLDIDKSELPQDREDRNAWTHKKNSEGKKVGVEVDLVKATELRDKKSRDGKIKKEKDKILEDQAIANLTERGEL